MNIEARAYRLLRKYFLNELAPREEQELQEILAVVDEEKIITIIERVFRENIPADNTSISDEGVDDKIAQILHLDKHSNIAAAPKIIRLRRQRYAIAVAVIVAILLAGLLRITRDEPLPITDEVHASMEATDFQPGKEGAILTLSDGTQIVLDSVENNTKIIELTGIKAEAQDGQLTYSGHHAAGGEHLYNTMTTPKGRQFRLTLSDGTQVWLNAASSITYPVSFAAQSDRKVTISGEVFFEVTHSENTPFVVAVKDQPTMIRVLGTDFNVNAYGDDHSIRTTLLEGAIRIEHHDKRQDVRPGQQAIVRSNSNAIQVDNVSDTEHVVAWQKSLFSFKDATLDVIMKDFARWYDIDIAFDAAIPNQKYSGKIDKNLTLQQALSILGATDVKYSLSDDKSIVIHN